MNELQIVEYQGERVLTTQQLAEAYGTTGKVISNNFNNNRERYVEGKHFICVTGDALRELKGKSSNLGFAENVNKVYFWTERGTFLHAKSLNNDKAWEVYDRLVEGYFNVRQIVDNGLSPNLQLMKSIVDEMERKERADRERDRKIEAAQETAQKAIESTAAIKEAVTPILDNWRPEINAKFNRIQKNADKGFDVLRSEMYRELERRAGCDLNIRLRNKRKRLEDSGCLKSQIKALNKMDVIEESKQLREIFSKIVTEYEIKYCA